MKVSQIPYRRYTIEEGKAEYDEFCKAIKVAECAEDVAAARTKLLDALREYTESSALGYCRFTLNTKDEFYQGEVDYYDENGPLFGQIQTDYAKAMLASPYRPELEKMLGKRRFDFFEIAEKSFNEKIIPDMQAENAVVTEYSKFMSELVFDYEGEGMPLSVLRGKLTDSDRKIRKKAAEAIGAGLGSVSDKLDDIFDRLVKIRTEMAHKMGYNSFTELGYYRMNRVDYNAENVARFRDNVAKYLVPCVSKIKGEIAKSLGIDEITFYDDAVYVDNVPVPNCDAKGIFESAQNMYDSMNPELGEFFAQMTENEAFDTESRDGKWGGGYCTCFPKEKQPFILANFNKTADDIDVITHEFGHAFAARNVYLFGDEELDVGGMETAECHSMSMEFFCYPSMDRFFDDADKYRYSHFLSALSFIPYGVIVDEFQHIVYDNPNLTPAERDAEYVKLEKKYRPYMNFSGIPYIEKGTRWQYQMHIYETPFYYIDYCLAQTVALSFMKMSRENYKSAIENYIAFSKKGGTEPFGTLVEDAGIHSPFVDGSLENLADECVNIAEVLKNKIK